MPRSEAEKLVPRELDRLLAPSKGLARVLVIDDAPRVASLLGAALDEGEVPRRRVVRG